MLWLYVVLCVVAHTSCSSINVVLVLVVCPDPDQVVRIGPESVEGISSQFDIPFLISLSVVIVVVSFGI